MGRPAFERLKNVPVTSTAFLFAFVAVSMIRHCVIGNADFVVLSFSLLTQTLLYFALATIWLKVKYMHTFIAVFVGTSVLVDSIAIMLLLTTWFSADNLRLPFTMLEMFFAVISLMKYFQFEKSQSHSKNTI